MNDDELIVAVRDSFTGVQSATPVEQIVRRSRTVRNSMSRPLQGVSTVHFPAAKLVEQQYRELHLLPTKPPEGVRCEDIIGRKLG